MKIDKVYELFHISQILTATYGSFCSVNYVLYCKHIMHAFENILM